jgi:HSP20 family protein
MERSFGAFVRVFQFPEEIDPDGVTAHFKDGLLRIELPKVRPRQSWRGRSGPVAG